MDVNAALAMGRSLLREHGLDGWRIKVDGAKTRAGVCRFARREIGISGPLTRLHDEALVRDTILHEIAHALVGPMHGHDATWRATALRIGCTGERVVDADAPRVAGDWLGTCPAGHEVTRHRRPMRVMSCSRCSPGFRPEHILAWTYRGRQVEMSRAYRDELERIRRRSRAPVPTPPAHHGSSSVGPAPQVSVPDRVGPTGAAAIGDPTRGTAPPGVEPTSHPAGAWQFEGAAASGPEGRQRFGLGDRVVIVSDGRLGGCTGVVEGVHATRCQVRVDDELYLIPFDVLRAVRLTDQMSQHA